MLISLSLGFVIYLPIRYIGVRDYDFLNGCKNSRRVEVGVQLSDQVGTRFMHPV